MYNSCKCNSNINWEKTIITGVRIVPKPNPEKVKIAAKNATKPMIIISKTTR